MAQTLIEILIIFLLLLLNGVFSMTELAMVSAHKVRLQQRADEGENAAQEALDLAENPNRLLSTIQIGITLIGVLTGALGGATLAERLTRVLIQVAWLAPYASGVAVAVVVILTTYFSLVIGELIPKRLAMNNPDKIAVAVAHPMRFLSRLTAPLVALLSASTEAGLRLLGVRPSGEPPVTEEEIKVLMEQGTQVGVFKAAEQDMVESVFRLGERYIDAIMTPRTEIEWLDLDESYEDLLRQVLESRHSRFPVASGGLDNVVGILRARDLLIYNAQAGNAQTGNAQKAHAQTGDDQDEKAAIQELMSPPLFVPDSMAALKVLEMIKSSGVHVALVIDEYGGLLGMVTLYDILAAIVGEIPTQGEAEEPEIIQREDGSWLLDGLLAIDELKDLLDLSELPDEEHVGYQTLGGFIMNQIGSIPAAGQHFEWGDYRFEVMDMDERRVDKVLVSPVEKKNL
ncbi:hemolysins [Longilinea arvoryzae]|uniref:Hemolysins n=1 Tax=Longilinea arvoryzae TaxID=360412 RepID=A0A0S7BJR7_9CHLR|nr:hemolysin family protein [Longilinea arvoryzae]GAP13882.1 hemolysins [Longilinea arvoryzae]